MRQASITSATGNDFEFPLTQADFQTIANIVHERSGIVLAQKRDMAYSRLAKRLRSLGLRSFKDYCSLLQSNKGAHEIGYLINAITTNLTKFFREPYHFEHLSKQALPEFVKSSREEKPQIKIWSAGCSSGEEPYSIAMTVIAARQEIRGNWEAEILASDLDTATLQKAKAGVYPEASLTDVPQLMRHRFFQAPLKGNNNQAEVTSAVKNLITFQHLNLLGPWNMSGRFDAIFCRNVMIYFDAKTKATLIERFHSRLKTGGWLYIGHSKSLLDHQTLFKLCGRTIYKKIKSTRPEIAAPKRY